MAHRATHAQSALKANNIDVTDAATMFISDESCLVGLPGFPGPGRAAWRMVERESMDPWYHVLLRVREGTRFRTKKLMPTDVSLLTDLLAQQSPTHLVEEVQVVTAPWINGSSSERMEKLVSLVIGYNQKGECVMLHKVASGAVYSSAQDGLKVSSLTDTRTIYEDTNQPIQEGADPGTTRRLQ